MPPLLDVNLQFFDETIDINDAYPTISSSGLSSERPRVQSRRRRVVFEPAAPPPPFRFPLRDVITSFLVYPTVFSCVHTRRRPADDTSITSDSSVSGEGSPGGKSEGYASSSSFQKSEVVPSDAEGAEDLLKGFAQRVEDPDVRETRAKGKLVTVQQQGKTARSYYTNEPAFLELVGKQGWSDGQGAKPSVAAERKIDADIDAAFAETDGNKTDEKHRRDGSRRKASDDMSGGSDEERAKDEAK